MPQMGSIASAPGSDAVTSGLWPRATCTISARMLTAISCGVTAPMSRPAGALTSSSRATGMARRRRRSTTDAARLRLATRLTYRAGVASAEASASASASPCVATTIGTRGFVVRRRDPVRRLGGQHQHLEIHRRAEPCECIDDGAMTDEQQKRPRQVRLHVDLQRSAAVAGHRILDEALDVRGATTSLTSAALADQADETGLPVTEGGQRLSHHGRLGTRAADPAAHAAVLANDGLGTGLGGGGTLAADDDRQRKRFTPPAQLAGEIEQVFAHDSEVYSVTPLSRSTRHTFAGVIGMSMLRTPRCHSASTTALAMAAGAPTVADSPTPLAPSGWCGDGVPVLPVSQRGVSRAVGTR